MDYTGSTVSGNSVAVLIISQPDLGGGSGDGCNPFSSVLGTTPGSYSYNISTIPSGSFYVVGVYGTFGSNGPNLGDYVGDYGNDCPLTGSTLVALSSGNPSASNVGVTFGNTWTLWGINATVNYSGSQTNGEIYVGLFSAVNVGAGTYTQITNTGVNSSGQTKTLIDQINSCGSTGASVYVIGWYGSNPNGPNAGDNYVEFSTTEVNNPTTTTTVNISSSATWP